MAGHEKISKEIQVKLAEAMKLIREAQALADQYKLSFSFDVSYGMGGTYYGDPAERDEDYSSDGWLASSNSC
jgi:hypothetical protein